MIDQRVLYLMIGGMSPGERAEVVDVISFADGMNTTPPAPVTVPSDHVSAEHEELEEPVQRRTTMRDRMRIGTTILIVLGGGMLGAFLGYQIIPLVGL